MIIYFGFKKNHKKILDAQEANEKEQSCELN